MILNLNLMIHPLVYVLLIFYLFKVMKIEINIIFIRFLNFTTLLYLNPIYSATEKDIYFPKTDLKSRENFL